jgi:pimeloyl-ACP methyl ester carboxylesterase
MKKRLLLILILIFVVVFSFGVKLNIPEEHIAVDAAGNYVYQIGVGEIEIGFKVIGEGEPLLLITGLGCEMIHWPQTILDMLSHDYQLILMDNRGMGYSSDVDKPYSYEMLSEDVISFMDAIGLEKTDMLGYSMGSIFIQYIMLNHPERLGRAILNATSYDTSGCLADLQKNANAELPTSGPVKKQLDIVDFWQIDPSVFSSVDNLVLFIHGTADDILAVSNSVVLSSYFENSWLIRFEGDDHYLIFEDPVDFAYCCLTFLGHKR